MPRSPAVKIAGARSHTQWTLSKDSASLSVSSFGTRAEEEAVKMESNGHANANGKPQYFDQHNSRYEAYEGSGYGSSRSSLAQYSSSKPLPAPPLNVQGHSGHYDGFDFSPSFDEPRPRETSGRFDDFAFQPPMLDDIRLDPGQEHEQDAVGRHLLYETALLDTQAYEIIDINEVDELKKELTRLHSRIEAANRKLALESKVKDAAHNIHRLYSATKKDGRPDTPQSPNDPRHGRNSLLGTRGRNGSGSSQGGTLHQAEDELAQSIKMVDDLNEQIKSMLERRQTVERKLLRHTAAVLAQQANQAMAGTATRPTYGLRHLSSDDAIGYAPDGFDGIRDILRGVPSSNIKQGNVQKVEEEHKEQLADVQSRLEQLNTQLRGVITEASRSRGVESLLEAQSKQSADARDRIYDTLATLENNVRAVEQEKEHGTSQHAERVGSLSNKLYNVMLTSPDMDMLQGLREPPKVTGNGYEFQLQYLEESLLTMEKILRKHREDLQNAKETSDGASLAIDEAQSKASVQAQKISELETVIAGLWELVASELTSTPRENEGSTPVTPIREEFSLQAFSSRVQHLCDVARGSKEQQDILRRQIQQQRDLNGKSDMEKDKELKELQARFDQLTTAYDATQVDLATSMASNEQAEREVHESCGELQNVMNELEQMRKTFDGNQAKQQQDVNSRNAQLSVEKSTAEQAHADLQIEMEKLESEVVRLTTELTMAKADLDGAYGTRQERKKEAGVAAQDMEALEKLKDQEIEALRKSQADRTKLLETELQDMMDEFQAMTRESLELEKERGQLEGLIDGLREKVAQLEQQLAEERVQSIGVKTPGGGLDPAPKESTSVMVLRQEFKRMMREARGEGIRALRVSIRAGCTDYMAC